jgi:filamentous hemagglutinin
LVSYVQSVAGVSGLSYADALTRYRAMSDTEKAALIDKKKTLSSAIVAAFLVAPDDAPYASLWQARVKAAAAAAPIGAVAPSVDDYQSALFGQFRDDVLMAELKRLGSAASGVADSSNSLYNARREAVRKQFWSLASQASDLAGLGKGFTSKGDINLAGSMVFTRGAGDFTHGGIDLYAPGGQVLVGYAGQSANDVLQAATRGLVTTAGGSIRSYSNGDFQVNSQKAFVVGTGDLLVYSANGNIDSGRGSNTSVAVTAKSIKRLDTGEVVVTTPPPITGSGIGIVKDATGNYDGKVSLLAPNGEVRALDAFIQGPVIEVPGIVIGGKETLLGAVKGQPPAPTVTASLSVNTGLGNEPAAGESKDSAIKKREKSRDASSVLTVDLLSVGDADASPAAGGSAPATASKTGNVDGAGKPADSKQDCERKPGGCSGK